jgi:hypothetical protein
LTRTAYPAINCDKTAGFPGFREKQANLTARVEKRSLGPKNGLFLPLGSNFDFSGAKESKMADYRTFRGLRRQNWHFPGFNHFSLDF